jgi:BirA family biotin operon repressor/biotin-[acetyl-CoA-carboxylase] ligase
LTEGEGPPPLHLAGGFQLEQVRVISSTSDACLSRARDDAPDGLAILAEEQTAARGSRGRGWIAPRGNLYLSVLVRPRNAAEAGGAGQWALLAGLAFIEALAAFDAEPDLLALKWPNDVLRDGAKLGGVLVDAEMGGAGLDWLVIGVGANLAVAPAVEGRRTAALMPQGDGSPPPIAVTTLFLDRIRHWRDVLAESGFGPVRDAWLGRAHPPGTAVTIKDVRGDRHGRFAGLSVQGELLLEIGEAVQAISTGDVLLGQGN